MSHSTERRFAQAGRSLAHDLLDYAHNRNDEAKRRIQGKHVELCRILREERGEPQEETANEQR